MIPLADQVVELVPSFTADGAGPQAVELAAGEVLFDEGSWGDRIYVLERGEIEIVRRRADGGGEERVAVVTAGSFFGEMGPLFQLPRSATARAATDATVTGYSVKDFKERVGVEHLADLLSPASLDQPQT
jgi:putative ABC transport system ATP-binding protein